MVKCQKESQRKLGVKGELERDGMKNQCGVKVAGAMGSFVWGLAGLLHQAIISAD